LGGPICFFFFLLLFFFLYLGWGWDDLLTKRQTHNISLFLFEMESLLLGRSSITHHSSTRKGCFTRCKCLFWFFLLVLGLIFFHVSTCRIANSQLWHYTLHTLAHTYSISSDFLLIRPTRNPQSIHLGNVPLKQTSQFKTAYLIICTKRNQKKPKKKTIETGMLICMLADRSLA
jgi:hypothetical protein